MWHLGVFDSNNEYISIGNIDGGGTGGCHMLA